MPHFELTAEQSADEILRGLGKTFPLVTHEKSRERVTYFDTFDWRLWGADLTLTSVRVGNGHRLHLTTKDGKTLEARTPRLPDFAWNLPEGPLKEALRPVSDIRRLLPRARADWSGEVKAVLNEDGKTVVRILIRNGEARKPRTPGPAVLPTRLELLPLKGYDGELARVASILRSSLGLQPSERTELAAVLEALECPAGDYSSSVDLELNPSSTAVEALREVHRSLLETMLINQEGIEKDLDSEFLHDFRVAVRKTRSANTQIKGVFPQDRVDHFLGEFKWLGSRTGPTRDMDVYLLKIPAYREALPEGVRDELEPLVTFLEKKKGVAHGGLVRTLGSKRYRNLLTEWKAFVEEGGGGAGAADPSSGKPTEEIPDPAAPNAHRPVRDVASERIRKAYRKVLKKGRRIHREAPAEALHRLRIDCKKLRYLMRFFQSLYPDEKLKPLLKELKRLQDNLGDFNDLQVQRNALFHFAEEMMETGVGPPATLMAMGQLMGQLETQQGREREAFRKRFKRFARKKNRRAFKELFTVGGGAEREAADRAAPTSSKGEGS